MLGEMKRSDAMAQLREVVWAPLPPADSQADKLTARDFEEMVQVKAVEGLAFLATPQADAAVREVIAKHEALHVRVSAIDAYMWNHGDRPETAAELYRLLPASCTCTSNGRGFSAARMPRNSRGVCAPGRRSGQPSPRRRRPRKITTEV